MESVDCLFAVGAVETLYQRSLRCSFPVKILSDYPVLTDERLIPLAETMLAAALGPRNAASLFSYMCPTLFWIVGRVLDRWLHLSGCGQPHHARHWYQTGPLNDRYL